MKELLVNININQMDTKKILYILQDKQGKLWVNKDDLQELNLHIPSAKVFFLQTQPYYQLNSISGLSYSLDSQALILFLTVSPALYPITIINPYQLQKNAIRPQHPGSFINYDIFAERDQHSSSNYSALNELGYFNHQGIGTTNFLFQRIHSNQFPGLDSNNRVTRLDTTWTLDQPEKIATWRLGDSITRPADWSSSVHFGGIEYSTNFATQPGYVTFPTPAFHGEAVVPTTVNVFVNNAIASSAKINSGPFNLTNVPVVTGAGNAVILTRNILGQETMVTLPYYASQGLLKPGLDDFSYEAGMVRNNYGINSFDYRRLLAVGTYRHGFSNQLTAGWHMELLREQQTVGIEGSYLWNNYGIVSCAAAGSNSRYLGQGGLVKFGFQRQTQRYNYGISVITTSRRYTELGIQPGQFAPKIIAQIFYGIASHALGSLSIGYLLEENRQTDPQVPFISLTPRNKIVNSFVTFSYNRNLFNNVYFSLSGLMDTRHKQNDQAQVALIWSFANSVSVSASKNYQTQQNDETVDVIKNRPFGNGDGYRLHAATGNHRSLEGEYAYQNNYGTYVTKAARVDHINHYQLEAQGSIVNFGGQTMLAREMQESFALVKVPGIAHIAVYNRNQIVGYTNKNGDLFIPFLLPYQANDIRIDPKDLPLDVEIDQDHKAVMPYFRSGVLVEFPTKKIKSVVFNLLLENGHAIPAGVMIFIKNSNDTYFVGDHGQVYLANLPMQETIYGTARWDKQICHFSIRTPITSDPQPNGGNIICKRSPAVIK